MRIHWYGVLLPVFMRIASSFIIVAVAIIPAFIWITTLITRRNHHFIRLLLHPVQMPDVIVDPFLIALGLAGYVHRYEKILLVRAVGTKFPRSIALLIALTSESMRSSNHFVISFSHYP